MFTEFKKSNSMGQNILILDSQPMMAQSIFSVLKEFLKDASLNLCCTLSQVSTIILKCKPNFIILDQALGKPNALKFYESVKLQSLNCKFLIFSVEEDYCTVKNYFKTGADGYLLRSASSLELVEAVTAIQNGEIFLDNNLRQSLTCQLITKTEKRKILSKITKRESEILQFVVDEYTTKEIAKLLFITPETVETHRTNLIQKFGVRNTAGLVRESLLRGTLNGFSSQGKS